MPVQRLNICRRIILATEGKGKNNTRYNQMPSPVNCHDLSGWCFSQPNQFLAELYANVAATPVNHIRISPVYLFSIVIVFYSRKNPRKRSGCSRIGYTRMASLCCIVSRNRTVLLWTYRCQLFQPMLLRHTGITSDRSTRSIAGTKRYAILRSVFQTFILKGWNFVGKGLEIIRTSG